MADNHFLVAYVEQAAIYVIIHQVQRSFSFLLSFLSPDFIPETEPSIRPRGRPLIEPALSNDVQDLRKSKGHTLSTQCCCPLPNRSLLPHPLHCRLNLRHLSPGHLDRHAPRGFLALHFLPAALRPVLVLIKH